MLKIQDLSKRYPNGTQALRGLSLTIEPGEVFGILGPNGAGKTTLMKLLLGVLTPSSGDISLDGICPEHAPLAFKKMVGVVHQFGAFDMSLSVLDNLGIFGAFQGLSKKVVMERSAYLLDRFEMYEKAKERIENLSGGQRRRVQLVRALLHRPKFLFLDEPTTGLDAFSRRKAWSMIMEEKDPNSYVLCASHYVEEIQRNCTRVMILDQGIIVAMGTPKDLMDSVTGHRVEVSLDRQPSEALLSTLQDLPSVIGISSSDSTLQLRVNDTEWTIAKILEHCFQDGTKVNSVVTKQASLEDVLLRATGRELS